MHDGLSLIKTEKVILILGTPTYLAITTSIVLPLISHVGIARTQQSGNSYIKFNYFTYQIHNVGIARINN